MAVITNWSKRIKDLEASNRDLMILVDRLERQNRAYSDFINRLGRGKQLHAAGDVFQINQKIGKDRPGLIGAFILATEIKQWGIQGFVADVGAFENQSQIYLRPTWEQVDFVGTAALLPEDCRPEDETEFEVQTDIAARNEANEYDPSSETTGYDDPTPKRGTPCLARNSVHDRDGGTPDRLGQGGPESVEN